MTAPTANRALQIVANRRQKHTAANRFAAFVHDIEHVFDRVERPSLEIVAGVILLRYSIPEAALHLGITVQRAERRYAAALDSLSALLLEVGLLRPVFSGGDEENYHSNAPGDLLPPRKPPLSVRIESHAPPQVSTAEIG